MCSSFAFGYFAPYFLRGVTHVATRLLSGIICAFVVAIADMYFVLKFLLEIEGVIQVWLVKLNFFLLPFCKKIIILDPLSGRILSPLVSPRYSLKGFLS